MNDILEARPTSDRGMAVFVTREIQDGQLLGTLTGARQDHRTRYTIERDGHHFDPDAPVRFINHACAPNARWSGRELRAVRSLRTGDEVTFDYTETESDFAAPFHCRCGSENCLGVVDGRLVQAPNHSIKPGASAAVRGV